VTAENLAKVVADIRHGRTEISKKAAEVWLPDRPDVDVQERLDGLRQLDTERSRVSVVIDAQRFYEQITNDPTDVYAHNMMPVWENAVVAYENDYGNVNVATVVVYPRGDHAADTWESINPVDWERVEYIYFVGAYLGGRTGAASGITPVPVATQGPLYLWRIAVYGDGEIADLNWQNPLAFDNNNIFQNLILCVLKAYDLGNCVNVELAEPHRSRAERRRIERFDVKVSEIHVRSISKSYRSNGKSVPLSPGVPLTSVRGHHSHYGPKYGRKLLFGKYEGRFWIPQHARGTEALGVIDQQYVVEPDR
jgi:hypothetical protein